MKKNSVGLLELETAVLECFLEKTPLSPLGVKRDFMNVLTCVKFYKCPQTRSSCLHGILG
jgi:hypothetical protein